MRLLQRLPWSALDRNPWSPLKVLRLLLITTLTQTITAQELTLRPAQPLYAHGTTLDVGDYAIPCAADWNGDGRKDLLVGYQAASKIALFLNVGSDRSPVLMNSVNLQAAGVDICLPSLGNCGAPAPFLCDYDNDGKRDLLVGSGADGLVYFYRNTNTDISPILDAGVPLMVGSAPLTVMYRATPYVGDWNGDGLNDLLCGNGDGWVFFFKNIGTAQSPAYQPGIYVQAGGTNLNLGLRAVVRTFDWDGDSVSDLVGSSTTGVYWCKNVGNNSSPVLLAPVAIRAPVAGTGLQPISVGPRMRLDLVDWTSDGVMDLLIGRSDGTIYYYEGYRFAFSAITAVGENDIALRWHSAPYLTYHILAGPSLTALTNLLTTNCPSGGNVTAWTNPISGTSQFYWLQIGQ